MKHTPDKNLKRYDLPPVSNALDKVQTEFELDVHAHKVRGILLTADLEDQLYHRAVIGLEINGREILSDDFHAKLLMSGLGVAPAARYFPLDHEAGNGTVRIRMVDRDHPSLAHQPYVVSVYLETENCSARG